MPSCAICVSSRISTATPASLATAAARRANSCGVSVLPGSLASSRARLLHSPSTRPRATAARAASAADSSPAAATTVHAGGARTSCSPCLVAAAVELRQRQPFRDRLRHVRRAGAAGGVRAHHERRARDAALPRPQPDGDRQLPRDVGAERRSLPGADHDEPPGPPGRVGHARREDARTTGRRTPSTASARATSPPVAASMPGTAAGPSSSNQGTTSRSASTD